MKSKKLTILILIITIGINVFLVFWNLRNSRWIEIESDYRQNNISWESKYFELKERNRLESEIENLKIDLSNIKSRLPIHLDYLRATIFSKSNCEVCITEYLTNNPIEASDSSSFIMIFYGFTDHQVQNLVLPHNTADKILSLPSSKMPDCLNLTVPVEVILSKDGTILKAHLFNN